VIRNDGPCAWRTTATLNVDRLRLVGEGTQFELVGDGASRRTASRCEVWATEPRHPAGPVGDIRNSGAAELQVDIRGAAVTAHHLRSARSSTAACVTSPAARHRGGHGRLESTLAGFGSTLSARMGGGAIRFGGRAAVRRAVALRVRRSTATARSCGALPEACRSSIDGRPGASRRRRVAVLAGTGDGAQLRVKGGMDAWAQGARAWRRLADSPALRRRRRRPPSVGSTAADRASTCAREPHRAPRGGRADAARDYDRPLLFGRAEIERGTSCSRASVPGDPAARWTSRTPRASSLLRPRGRDPRPGAAPDLPGRLPCVGTPDRFVTDLTSTRRWRRGDPLVAVRGARSPQDADLRALRAPGLAEQELVVTQAAQLLASPCPPTYSASWRRLRRHSVRTQPSFGDLSAQETLRLNPSARGHHRQARLEAALRDLLRAISTTTREQIILVEYDQSDRLPGSCRRTRTARTPSTSV